jgi:hypothetical protein
VVNPLSLLACRNRLTAPTASTRLEALALRHEIELAAARLEVRLERERDVLGGAARHVPGEPVERQVVRALHERRDARLGLGAVAAEAGPDVECVKPVVAVASCVAGGALDRERRLGPASRRHPHADPPVAVAAGAPQRGVGAPAHDDRQRGGGRRPDRRPVDGEEPPFEADLLAGQEAAQERQRLLHPGAARARVDAAELELAPVVAAEREPAGRQ